MIADAPHIRNDERAVGPASFPNEDLHANLERDRTGRSQVRAESEQTASERRTVASPSLIVGSPLPERRARGLDAAPFCRVKPRGGVSCH
jgi:hypothetical protein